MKFHLIHETIDGSIKDIIQLKTLDPSLEYSQMFDALKSTPDEFQAKLIQTLNSLAETMQVDAVDAFNRILCASDDEKDVKKKLYKWWGDVFEVLSKVDVPREHIPEFNEKVDDLMAEILKAGDSEGTGEGEGDEAPVMESDEDLGYKQADKEEEDRMLADFEFAIGKIGEIANKVKDLVNFINPWCESNEVNTTMKKTNESKTSELDMLKHDYITGAIDYPEIKFALMDLDMDEEMASEQALEWDEEKDEFYGDFLNLSRSSDRSTLVKFLLDSPYFNDEDEANAFIDDQIGEGGVDECVTERGDSEWVSMDDMIGPCEESSDSEDDDELEENAYHIGDKVIWDDPDGDATDGWEVTNIKGEVYVIKNPETGSEAEVPEHEICLDDNYKVKESIDGEFNMKGRCPECGGHLDFNSEDDTVFCDKCGEEISTDDIADISSTEEDKFQPMDEEESKQDEVKPNDDKEGGKKFKDDDGEVRTMVAGEKKLVNEMTIEQEITSCDQLLRLLWGQAKSNLEELMRSGLAQDDVIMECLEESGLRNLTEINDYIAYDFKDFLDALGLDGEKWYQDGVLRKPGADDDEEMVELESSKK